MRRPPARRSLVLLAFAFAWLCVPALAVGDGFDGGAVLAAEEENGEAEILGPDPAERTAEGNPAREMGGYEDRETPFTWGAAWILTFAGLVGLVLMLGVYYLVVRGPSRSSTSR